MNVPESMFILTSGLAQSNFAQTPSGLEDLLKIGILSAIGAFVAFNLLIFAAKRFLYVCGPNEILVLSGRRYTSSSGTTSGYKVFFGGRVWRRPFIETIEQMPLSTIPLEVGVNNAYSKGGIPLRVAAIANVKISSDPEEILNAVERFLGRGIQEIRQVARETLEGTLRGIVATMTPEDLNEDRLAFAERIGEEADADLAKLGIQLDTLKIQAITDEIDYLDSIGRADIARILKTAEIAESDAEREAEKVAADANAKASIAAADAERLIVEQRNAMRAIEEELNAQVEAEKLKAEAEGQEARAIAEQELQELRQELEKLRLQADVVIPAAARREAMEMEARANAAPIEARGEAVAESLRLVAEAWRDAGPDAAQIYVIDQIEQLAGRLAETVKNIDIGEIHLIDDGRGESLPNLLASFPEAMTSIMDGMKQSLGVDIPGLLSNTATEDGSDGGKPATKTARKSPRGSKKTGSA